MDFEFATAARIVFGWGQAKNLGAVAASFGKMGLIVTGRSSERAARCENLLASARVKSRAFHLPGEPTVHDVAAALELARREGCDFVLGLGGGSALDAAKAVAALLTNPGDLFDYLEVVGRGQPLPQPSAPCLAVPTTAGTGTEVTRNAVLASPQHRFKVSLRSPFMLPRLALVDPELTLDLPPALTASTGMDALTQLIEPYVSSRANPLTDGFCIEGIGRVARSLLRACQNGTDNAARTDMSLASLLSGLALANAGLGAVHGFAAPLGGMFAAAHGALCAAVLPAAMEINIRALRARDPDGQALRRYARVGALLTGRSQASPEDAVSWTRELADALEIRGLRGCGVPSSAFPEVVAKAAKASSMKANPIVLTPEEMQEILERSS
ncbi:MAG: iron-containing alcohol dehydrogenase [Verrucomicrobiota bacterium]